MFREQTCPRCKSRMNVDRDEHGWFVECITCGYMRDLHKVAVTKENKDTDKGKPASAQVP